MSRVDSDSSFIKPVADLMTSLFVVFVLLLLAYINRSYNETKAATVSIRDDLYTKLQRAHIDVKYNLKDPLELLIPLPDSDLEFGLARSDIKADGRTFLQEFVPRLAHVLTDGPNSKNVQSLIIEGHTDSTGGDEDNLRLSQDRSYQVLKFVLNDSGLNSTERDFFLERASANGRGERDLLPENAKPGSENKEQSRRVEIKIRLRSFEQRNMTATADAIKAIRSKDK